MVNDKHICYELAKRAGHDFPVSEPPPNDMFFFRERDDQSNVAYPNYLKDDEKFFRLIVLTLKAILKATGILDHSGFDTAVFNTIKNAWRINSGDISLPDEDERRSWLTSLHNGIEELDGQIDLKSVR